MRSKILENQVRSGQLSSGQFFCGRGHLGSFCPGRGGGPNVIVGCVPPLKWSSLAFDRGGQTGPPRSNAFFFGAVRSSLAFDRGGQTRPPRSNAFFFGAADDTGAADDRPAGRPARRLAGRPAMQTSGRTPGRTWLSKKSS